MTLSRSFPSSLRALLLATLLSLPLLTLATPAAAQQSSSGTTFGGPPEEVSVQSILENPPEDQQVMLRGRLMEQVDNEKYLFTDGNAQVRVEIDDEVFTRQEITPEMEVQIYGEVEDDFLQDPEIDVERLTVPGNDEGNGAR